MDRGKFGEELAKNFLINKGYKILFQNYRTRFSEIDIIAEKNKTLIFVEVKYRTNKKFGKAEESINYFKLEKIKKAATMFVKNFKTNIKRYRFDIIAINNFDTLEINHYENVIE